MAIKRLVRAPGADTASLEVTVPTFSFDSTGLAELVVEAWTKPAFRDKLLERGPDKKVTTAASETATKAVNARGFNLKRAVVITEDEHDHHYIMQTPNEVVFVLPDPSRLSNPNSDTLLQTARLLMSCTPNGI